MTISRVTPYLTVKPQLRPERFQEINQGLAFSLPADAMLVNRIIIEG